MTLKREKSTFSMKQKAHKYDRHVKVMANGQRRVRVKSVFLCKIKEFVRKRKTKEDEEDK